MTGLWVRACGFKLTALSLPCRFLNPLGMFTAMAVVSAIFLGSVWAGENRAAINNFKRQNPTAFVFFVMVASYILVSLLGSVMVFMTAITFPLACKSRSNVAGNHSLKLDELIFCFLLWISTYSHAHI